jgi:hypothetical protein
VDDKKNDTPDMLNVAACNNRWRLRRFRVGKELCKQRVTFGAEASVVLVKQVGAGDCRL